MWYLDLGLWRQKVRAIGAAPPAGTMGFVSMLAFWMGGAASAPVVASQMGFVSMQSFWMGGAGGG